MGFTLGFIFFTIGVIAEACKNFNVIQKIKFYGYADSPSKALSTTKRTKNTKRDFKFILSSLRDLRVFRGKINIGPIELELPK